MAEAEDEDAVGSGPRIRAGLHVQIVRFELAAGQAEAFIAALGRHIEDWIGELDGFVSASYHASAAGDVVLNYAQWRDAAAFEAFLADPRQAGLRAELGAFGPLRATSEALRLAAVFQAG